MKLYLDNCAFNRPFDDQTHIRIRLEAEAKLRIQDDIRTGQHQLVWSYILDFENGRNPFAERREQIARWRGMAGERVIETPALLEQAAALSGRGIKPFDALHIACACAAGADTFITTDDGILKRIKTVAGLAITDPIDFIKG